MFLLQAFKSLLSLNFFKTVRCLGASIKWKTVDDLELILTLKEILERREAIKIDRDSSKSLEVGLIKKFNLLKEPEASVFKISESGFWRALLLRHSDSFLERAGLLQVSEKISDAKADVSFKKFKFNLERLIVDSFCEVQWRWMFYKKLFFSISILAFCVLFVWLGATLWKNSVDSSDIAFGTSAISLFVNCWLVVFVNAIIALKVWQHIAMVTWTEKMNKGIVELNIWIETNVDEIRIKKERAALCSETLGVLQFSSSRTRQTCL